MGTSFHTVSQTGKKLGLTRQRVQQLIDAKELQAVWMLERWAIADAEIQRFKAERLKKNGKRKAA